MKGYSYFIVNELNQYWNKKEGWVNSYSDATDYKNSLLKKTVVKEVSSLFPEYEIKLKKFLLLSTKLTGVNVGINRDRNYD